MKRKCVEFNDAHTETRPTAPAGTGMGDWDSKPRFPQGFLPVSAFPGWCPGYHLTGCSEVDVEHSGALLSLPF